jgi:hypothetical protein
MKLIMFFDICCFHNSSQYYLLIISKEFTRINYKWHPTEVELVVLVWKVASAQVCCPVDINECIEWQQMTSHLFLLKDNC